MIRLLTYGKHTRHRPYLQWPLHWNGISCICRCVCMHFEIICMWKTTWNEITLTVQHHSDVAGDCWWWIDTFRDVIYTFHLFSNICMDERSIKYKRSLYQYCLENVDEIIATDSVYPRFETYFEVTPEILIKIEKFNFQYCSLLSQCTCYTLFMQIMLFNVHLVRSNRTT